MQTSHLPIACLLLASAFSPFAVSIAHSQAADSLSKPVPYFLNLSPPVYPPLARQARIGGDVVLQIGVRPDGSVASAEVISGHAMLKPAALDSARKSTFPRQEGSEATTFYSLTYTFGFRVDPGADCIGGGKFVRAAKCLYLRKCAWRNAPPIAYAIGEYPGHVIILAPSACVETMASSSACYSGHLK
jgi:TonB family protein